MIIALGFICLGGFILTGFLMAIGEEPNQNEEDI